MTLSYYTCFSPFSFPKILFLFSLCSVVNKSNTGRSLPPKIPPSCVLYGHHATNGLPAWGNSPPDFWNSSRSARPSFFGSAQARFISSFYAQRTNIDRTLFQPPTNTLGDLPLTSIEHLTSHTSAKAFVHLQRLPQTILNRHFPWNVE